MYSLIFEMIITLMGGSKQKEKGKKHEQREEVGKQERTGADVYIV